jgi:hypothetical protein
MHYFLTTLNKFLWIGLTAAILMSCGAKGKPSDYQPTADEMKPGPGLLTGEDGEFALYDSKKGGPFWKQSQEKSEEATNDTGKEAPVASDKPSQTTRVASGQTSKESEVTPEEAKEFREFQEWKQEQKEFQEFQKWKKTSKGAAEYKEFLEWKEWKSYQEWKKQQGQ